MQVCTTPTAPQIDAVLAARYHIADHREVWGQVLPGIESLFAMHPDQDWSIAGLREMLDEDRAFLLVDDADPTAFVIVRFSAYPYSADDIELFVLLAWHQGGDAIDRFQPHLEMFARSGNAKHMRFYSRRPAFLRVAQRHGYQMRGIEYVKEIDHVIR
jgi:hypothetical protein